MLFAIFCVLLLEFAQRLPKKHKPNSIAICPLHFPFLMDFLGKSANSITDQIANSAMNPIRFH